MSQSEAVAHAEKEATREAARLWDLFGLVAKEAYETRSLAMGLPMSSRRLVISGFVARLDVLRGWIERTSADAAMASVIQCQAKATAAVFKHAPEDPDLRTRAIEIIHSTMLEGDEDPDDLAKRAVVVASAGQRKERER